VNDPFPLAGEGRGEGGFPEAWQSTSENYALDYFVTLSRSNGLLLMNSVNSQRGKSPSAALIRFAGRPGKE